MYAVKPEDLGITLGVGPLARPDGSGIVSAAFGIAGAALDRAHIVAFNHYLDGVYPLRIIVAGRAEDYAEYVRLAGVHADESVRRKYKRRI